jgi:hypothetical protein
MLGFTRALAVFFLLFSGGCFVLIAEVDTAVCARDDGTCRVTHRKVYRTFAESFPVADLTGAELSAITGFSRRQGEEPGLRVVFLTKQGPKPFMRYATALAQGEMEEQAAAVARFVATPTVTRLDLRRDNRVSSLLIAAVPLALGVLLLWLSVRFKSFLAAPPRKAAAG